MKAVLLFLAGLVIGSTAMAASDGPYGPMPGFANAAPPAPFAQTAEEAKAKSDGCFSCHKETDSANMHSTSNANIGCVDCHGGDATAFYTGGLYSEDEVKRRAHVQPRFPAAWKTSSNPEKSYALLNRESPEFIRFINPGDLRIAREACGACHLPIVQAVERSLMATGAMLIGGAAYNNGIVPYKNYLLGEAYTRDGRPAQMKAPVKPNDWMKRQGILESLLPVPTWHVTPPADIFRVFERGGRNIVTQFPDIGIPSSAGATQRIEEPGRPDIRQSNRGPGTGLRIAVPLLNMHKTRLNDPYLWFLGTNEQPGDYRSSGCSGCHVVYANDRDPRHSGPYAKFGHDGKTVTKDPTIPKTEQGHPITHTFTNAIPTSQCMVCHMHQPNIFVNSYLGYTMWDYETDAPTMWPEKQKYPTHEEARKILDRNPEEASIRGKWGDPEFSKKVADLNPTLKNTQFADYHGHGWNFRAIFKKDRKGNFLDRQGKAIDPEDPDKFKKTIHMSSVHLDKGMQCVDCHFSQDAHGNGHIYGEVAAAIQIRCVDCHGTADSYPTLKTSGPAAPTPSGYDLSLMRAPDGRKRFEWRGTQCDRPLTEVRDCKLYQRAALDPNQEWEMSLVKDTVTPGRPHYNPLAARAKLMAKDTAKQNWGTGVAPQDRAHKTEEMECFTCHLSWTTSCAGCHLPIQANWKTESLHFDGGEARNYATYNPQVVRDEMFQLGKHGTVKNNTIAPVRSSSALVLSSQNINRERIYIAQPPIAASGYSSQAFAPHYSHTERKEETKSCTECHLSKDNDNNALMAQLLLLGTNFVNFIGPYAWVGAESGVEGVHVAEYDEPQAVMGSYLHKYAYPDYFKAHLDRGRNLDESYGHKGGPSRCVMLSGEYLYSAEGSNGTWVYDVASIANKGISQRVLTAPFSALGHDPQLKSADATCVALPTNQPVHPPKNESDLMRVENQEQPMHPIYSYAFVTDSKEGLILFNNTTFKDGEPRNNFVERALTWNPGGVLTGARHITIAGSIFYIAVPDGVVVLDMDKPLAPKVVAKIPVTDARATAVQFRYLFVAGKDGLSVVDVTDTAKPRVVPGAVVPIADARRLYVARTMIYVAAGAQGLAIIDAEYPEKPILREFFTANGQINDAQDVVVASTNASLFAYIADGANGLRVLQLTSPDSQPRFYGFSPDPVPELIATRKTAYPALSLAKGLDRDRGVDETGHQIAIFGRLGSRPFNLEEMKRLYLDKDGKPWYVTDDVLPNGAAAGTTPKAR